jgi:phosphatidylserine/phosphatidylglycerophosphate/cardiolipin synthase-like enzyme
MSRGSLPIALVAITAVIVTTTMHGRPALPRAELPLTIPSGSQADRLIVEPDGGMAPVYSLLSSARHSLDLTMYELVDPTAESLLAQDVSRGVAVRVVLDHRLEARRNLPAYDYLRSRGVSVAWSSARFFATHEKAFVIDRRTAVVMSLNLTDQYYATSRDLALVDSDPADVAAIESVFAADFDGRVAGTPAADDLVWSPNQSMADLLALIGDARHSIALESEELASPAIVRALLAARRRGVSVTVAMTYDDAAAPAFRVLTAAGARVSVLYGETPLYIHAKLLVTDAGTTGARAFLGSENLSDASLLHDRELGVVLVAPPLVDQVAATIATDVTSGRPWR